MQVDLFAQADIPVITQGIVIAKLPENHFRAKGNEMLIECLFGQGEIDFITARVGNLSVNLGCITGMFACAAEAEMQKIRVLFKNISGTVSVVVIGVYDSIPFSLAAW